MRNSKPPNPPERIPMDRCVPRRVYKVWSRNLRFAVYDGNGGFCGIRYKLGSRFLFTEYHWDKCKHHGTVRAMRDIGIDLPDEISLEERLGTEDYDTKRRVHFKYDLGKSTGKWYFNDTGEHGPAIRPCSISNQKLFDFLDQIGSSDDAEID